MINTLLELVAMLNLVTCILMSLTTGTALDHELATTGMLLLVYCEIRKLRNRSESTN